MNCQFFIQTYQNGQSVHRCISRTLWQNTKMFLVLMNKTRFSYAEEECKKKTLYRPFCYKPL